MKWSGDAFEPRSLKAFRAHDPRGRNWLVTSQTGPAFTREVAGHEVTSVGIEGLRTALAAAS